MSLQLWLPFNGSLKNQGLLNVTTPTTNVTYGQGKIGEKGLKSSTKVSYDISSANISTHQLSFSFWAKSDVYTGTSTAWWQLCSFNCSDSTKFHIYCVSNARYKIEYNPELNNYCDTTLWHHFTYILNGTKLTIYTNGIQTAQANVTNVDRIISSISFGVNTVCINDFRLYNHILSQHEIEKDYASLLIHYPLRDLYVENTVNLLNGRFDGYGSLTIPVTSAVYNENDICTLKTGGTAGTTGSIRSYIPLSKLTNGSSYSIQYKWKLISGSGTLKPGDWCDGSVTTKKNNYNGEYYEVEAFLPGRSTYDSIYRFLDFNSVGAESIYEIWDVQLEEKDHSTAFTISNRSNEPVYDCSGRGHDSVDRGDLIVKPNSLRNSYCTHFTPNNAIKIPSPYGSTLTQINDFSVAMWINLVTTGDTYKTIFTTRYGSNTGSNAGWISLNTEGKTLWFYNGQYHGVNSSNFTIGQWHHIAVTYKDGLATWYLDGQQIGNPIQDTAGSVGAHPYFCLGDGYTGTSWNGANFEGSISDFRFYGTAIPATIIKDLYQNSATIDNQGSIHTFEYVEV